MFPASAFNQPPLGYPYAGQQPPPSIYQSQFGGIAGFNPVMTPTFPQVQSTRGQSLPATGRQYPPATGPYAPPQAAGPSTTPRRQQVGQYQPPPPAPSQHYEYRSNHVSKSKKNQKRRSVSPNGVAEQGLYSDQEQQQQQQRKERREPSEGPQDSRTQSPTVASRSKQEGATDNDQQQQSQGTEGVSGETATQSGVARSEEEQTVGENEKNKSSSKKKKHHRRDRYENYNIPPTQPGSVPLDLNPNNPFQQPYPPQPYGQQPPYFGEYQNELPPQLKVHRQPLYSSYNQAYEESIRRGDVYRKQAKRSTRLPPEVKQQLLPHEDDQRNQSPAQPGQPTPHQPQPPPAPQGYPYGPVPGYPQPPPPQPLQPYGNIRPPFNPYQPYGPPPTQPNYYGSVPGTTPYNALQPWSNLGGIGGPAEQEIQRLRSHIHTLEGELHRLQRRLSKATINNDGLGADDDDTRSYRRSKRDGAGSPRQTPVIVELNNTTGEGSSKKHRHRTASNISTQPAPATATTTTTTQPAGEQQKTGSEFQSATTTTEASSGQAQQVVNDRERSRSGGNQISEGDNKVVPSKNPREETAAQLAHAAAAHVNNRQAGVVGGAPLPQQQQQQQQQPQQPPQPSGVAPPPPPPPVSQVVNRPQLPNQQQQQQQQFLYQQGVLPPQGQQIRGPAPRMPIPGNNIRYPVDPYQQQFVQPQQRNLPNPNYNQSNNNELFDTIDDVINQYERQKKQEEQSRSAEKILDAFERFYVNRGKPSTVPMKVKYIPEDINSNVKPSSNEHFYQQNTNNNNRYRSTSRSYSSSSRSGSIYSHSPVSSRPSLYDNNNQQKPTIGPLI